MCQPQRKATLSLTNSILGSQTKPGLRVILAAALAGCRDDHEMNVMTAGELRADTACCQPAWQIDGEPADAMSFAGAAALWSTTAAADTADLKSRSHHPSVRPASSEQARMAERRNRKSEIEEMPSGLTGKRDRGNEHSDDKRG